MNQHLEELKRLIHEQAEDEKRRVLEIAKAFEEAIVPKEKIASRIIHNSKKEFKERIQSL